MVAVEAGSMEEGVGLTVGKVTTMDPCQASCKRRGWGDSLEFISIRPWDR